MDSNELELLAAYKDEERGRRLNHSIVGVVLAIILVPLGSTLDFFVYPELLWQVFGVRILCAAAMTPILLILLTKRARRYVSLLTAIWAMCPVVAMLWMIYISEGPKSPYYAGLNLVILAICLIPFTKYEAFGFSLVVLGGYVFTCILHSGWNLDASYLFNSLFFLSLTSIIAVVSCHFHGERDKVDFSTRYQLDQRNSELTDLDRAKSEFFANVSHELRTPLTLILTPVEEMLRTGSLSPQVREPLQLVEKHGFQLLRLIDDLLEVVRLEGGALNLSLSEISLEKLAQGMAESMRSLAESKKVELHFSAGDESLCVWGDESRLERVLLNLLGNAVKFTPPGGTVRVECRRDGASAIVSVRDTGPGIPAEDQPFIFDRFRQAKNTSEMSHQGVGLGLSLVRELANAHEGDVELQSEVGEGSTFTVRLPLREIGSLPIESSLTTTVSQVSEAAMMNLGMSGQAENETTGDLSTSPTGLAIFENSLHSNDHPAKQGLVLVAEDQPDIRRFLVGCLGNDYQIIQAENGKEALRLIEERRPDVVILDWMMPEMSGLEVCRELLRQQDRLEDRPDSKVLVLTARSDDESKLHALEAGADDYLTKPFSVLELRTRVRNLLQSARLQKRLRERRDELQVAMEKLSNTETRLIHSQKMNSLGSLASGLLHEINNPLAQTLAALHYAQLKAAKATDNIDVCEALDDIGVGMNRVADIVSELRDFAHPQKALGHAEFSLYKAVTVARQFTAQELGGILVEVDVDEKLQITGSFTNITQVLVNMLMNAAQATEETASERTPKIRISAKKKQKRVRISVWDNGSGIDDETRDRIFDPFFTTKDVGSGLGLGLSICHTIVANHGGEIQLNSESGQWSELIFDLPLAVSEQVA